MRLDNIGVYKKGPFGSALTKSIFVKKSNDTVKVYEQKNAIYKNEKLGDYYITKKYFDAHMKGFDVNSGDIIVSCAGTIGETFILPDNIEKGIINQALMRIRLFNSVYKPYFLIYFDYIIKKAAQQSSKGSAIKNIPPFDIFKQMLFPIPPLNEQQRIVAEIEKIFKQIEVVKENQEELSKLKDGLKNKILDLAIQGKLVEQDPNDEPASVLLEKIKAEKAEFVKQGKIKKDKQESYIFKGADNRHYEQIGSETKDITDEIPFDIPNNWEWVRFKDLFNIVSSKRVLQSDWKMEGIPFYRAREIVKLSDFGFVKNELYISEDLFVELSKSYLMPEENDIMVSAVGTIGKAYIVKATDRFYYKDASVLCYKNISKIIPEYVKLFMESECFVSQYSKDSGGTTVDTLTIVRANQYLIPLPPIKEQEQIVAKIKILQKQINLL